MYKSLEGPIKYIMDNCGQFCTLNVFVKKNKRYFGGKVFCDLEYFLILFFIFTAKDRSPKYQHFLISL